MFIIKNNLVDRGWGTLDFFVQNQKIFMVVWADKSFDEVTMLSCQHVAWNISALQQQSSKYMFKYQSCVCFQLRKKKPHKFSYKYINRCLTSAVCPYSGQGLPSGAVRARSRWCSGAGKRRPVGCPLQPGGSGSGHLFLSKLRSRWPAQARSPRGAVTRMVFGYVCCFMMTSFSFNHVGLFTQVHDGGSRSGDESTGSAEGRRLEDSQWQIRLWRWHLSLHHPPHARQQAELANTTVPWTSAVPSPCCSF